MELTEEVLRSLEKKVAENYGLRKALEEAGLPVRETLVLIQNRHRDRFRQAFRLKKEAHRLKAKDDFEKKKEQERVRKHG